MTPLLERDVEFAKCETLFAHAAGGRGGILLVEARPGLGKTRLLQEVRGRAADLGLQVAHARGSQLESTFPFGIVQQLVEPLLGDVSRASEPEIFAGAAALARTALEAPSVTPAAAGPDRLGVLHGLYWLFVNLAARAPLLLAVDDAQWADESSLAFLSFLARRADELPLAVICARRPLEPGAPDESLGGLEEAGLTGRLQLRPLSASATAALTTQVLDGPDPEFCARCHRLAHGNPFMVVELCRSLALTGIPPNRETADRLEELVPDSIVRHATARLARLPPAAVALAHAAATLGDGAGLRQAADLAGLGLEDATRAADALFEAGLFSSVAPLEFTHPLLQAVLLSDRPPAEQAAAHGRAARILDEAGQSLDRVCAHLLRAQPTREPWVIARLRAGAAVAMSRGTPSTAVRYLRRALDQAPPRAAREAVLMELAEAETLTGDPAAGEHLNEVFTNSATERSCGLAALQMGRLAQLAGQIAPAVERMRIALRELEAADPALALATHAEMISAAQLSVGTAPLAHSGAADLQRRAARQEPLIAAPGYAALASLRAIEGAPAEEVARLAARAWTGGQLAERLGPASVLVHISIFALMFVDRLEQALALADTSVATAQRQGAIWAAGLALCTRSHLHFRAGRIKDAEADARQALVCAEDLPVSIITVAARAFLADARLAVGDVDEAFGLVHALDPGDERGGVFAQMLHTRGRVHLARREPERALADLLECGRRNDGIGAVNPATIPWRSAAAEAHLALGDVRAARTLAVEELELASRYGGPRARGVALITLGRCEADEPQVLRLHEAVRSLEASDARLDYARALIELGAAQRRANRRREARPPLIAGRELAARCGALALDERARVELEATGARPRDSIPIGVDSLTASELRVCRMAAVPLSNPEIAQSLFITRKTVEKHLSSAYMKLGIRSREDLAPMLGEPHGTYRGAHETVGRLPDASSPGGGIRS